ncbi:MAG: hypothetical protein NTY96_12285 [Bacteroidetes bacterium]|nr:hypothetical protein [Bacteroidota bacterium]
MKYSTLLFFLLALSIQLSGQKLFIVEAFADPDTICQGQYSQLSVTIQGGQSPFSYSWSPAPTLSNPASPNPLATPLVNTMYYVVVTDAFYDTATDSVMVQVETIPPPPSPIYGPAEVCSGAISDYSISEFFGATSYSWTVPTGAVIQSGQNTPAIQLKWGKYSGTISVIIGNNCGTSVPSVLSVEVTPFPSASLEILGPSHICQSDTGSFYTDTIPNTVHYLWIVPWDAVILSGDGTPAVSVKWGVSAGTISVSGENSCGTGPSVTKIVAVDSLPSAAGVISGPDTVCIGEENYNYSITPLPNATSYVWTLPQGATITSGLHTNRITVEFWINALPGPITTFGVNGCGNGQASIKQIITKNCSGFEENRTGPGIFISPNPVSDKLFIHTKGTATHYEVIIVDQLGEILYHTSLAWPNRDYIHEIDVTGLPHGIMYLKLFNESGSFTAKFIVL